MAIATNILYTARCDDCGGDACGGCWNNTSASAISCAVGCGYAKAKDNPKVAYCSECKSDHKCRLCGDVHENLDPDRKRCKECAARD